MCSFPILRNTIWYQDAVSKQRGTQIRTLCLVERFGEAEEQFRALVFGKLGNRPLRERDYFYLNYVLMCGWERDKTLQV